MITFYTCSQGRKEMGVDALLHFALYRHCACLFYLVSKSIKVIAIMCAGLLPFYNLFILSHSNTLYYQHILWLLCTILISWYTCRGHFRATLYLILLILKISRHSQEDDQRQFLIPINPESEFPPLFTIKTRCLTPNGPWWAGCIIQNQWELGWHSLLCLGDVWRRILARWVPHQNTLRPHHLLIGDMETGDHLWEDPGGEADVRNHKAHCTLNIQATWNCL